MCSQSKNTRGVWYTYTAKADGIIKITTSSASFNHEIVVFRGKSCDAATCTGKRRVGSSGDTTSLSFVGKSGVKYYILVTGYHYLDSDAFHDVGTFTLDIKVSE